MNMKPKNYERLGSGYVIYEETRATRVWGYDEPAPEINTERKSHCLINKAFYGTMSFILETDDHAHNLLDRSIAGYIRSRVNESEGEALQEIVVYSRLNILNSFILGVEGKKELSTRFKYHHAEMFAYIVGTWMSNKPNGVPPHITKSIMVALSVP